MALSQNVKHKLDIALGEDRMQAYWDDFKLFVNNRMSKREWDVRALDHLGPLNRECAAAPRFCLAVPTSAAQYRHRHRHRSTAAHASTRGTVHASARVLLCRVGGRAAPPFFAARELAPPFGLAGVWC